MTPRVSVVVPTFRRHTLLVRCLTALTQQTFPRTDYEILVADDAASPATRALVEAFARQSSGSLRYIPVTGAHGPAAARNAGWRAASGEVIAFTDDDCVPTASWLSEGCKHLAAGADAVWGPLCMPLSPIPTDYERDAARLAEAPFVTANCFVRRAIISQVGGFDERFPCAWREDSDLWFSLIEHNAEIVHAPGAVVVHPIRPAAWGASLAAHRKTMHDALLYKKHPQLYQELLDGMPVRYYAILTAGLVAMLAFLVGLPLIAMTAATAWFALTVEFAYERLQGTSHSWRHLTDIGLTSILIPPLALYWRMRGCLRYRVWFVT